MVRAAFYGDDFTGSVDALLQFRRAGLSGVLVAGPDLAVPPGSYDVIGIAGVARSLPTQALADEVVPALRRLRDLRPAVVQYKVCSTADSSPEIGSIGRVLELARDLFPPAPVPIVFAQPDFGRYTFFGHHFARDGDAVYRLDRQPTMMSHPVTPAGESDLRLHVARQTALRIGAVHWPRLDLLNAAALNEVEAAAVVCDAFTDEHLDRIAAAVLAGEPRPRFVVGSGGLSGALGRLLDVEDRVPLPASVAAAAGPTLVLNGSRSALTRRQVAAAGADVVVHSDGSANRLAELADAGLRQDPKTRLILCGGDTSGAVLRQLGVRTLEVVSAPWGNVVLCRAFAAERGEFEVVVKGGQMGHPDLFDDVKHGRQRC
ncbi:four-carbon acid sugar kinase family protein [Flindersiella endophytica]